MIATRPYRNPTEYRTKANPPKATDISPIGCASRKFPRKAKGDSSAVASATMTKVPQAPVSPNSPRLRTGSQ